MTSKRAVIAGCARNCAISLPHVLANVERIAGQFADVAFVFVENDSTDLTKRHLSAWGGKRQHFHLLCLDGLAASCEARTVRLATARNAYLDFLKDSGYRDYDYLVVLDMDNTNERPLDPALIARAISFLDSGPDVAAGFANQGGNYFDLWALRHAELCPGDIWEDLYDYVVANGVSDEVAFAEVVGKRQFSIPADAMPREVESAFGGLGVYRMQPALGGRYLGQKTKMIRQHGTWQPRGWQVCEHVHFHAAIRGQGGRLFILPWLINWIPPRGADLLPSAYRGLLVDPL